MNNLTFIGFHFQLILDEYSICMYYDTDSVGMDGYPFLKLAFKLNDRSTSYHPYPVKKPKHMPQPYAIVYIKFVCHLKSTNFGSM